MESGQNNNNKIWIKIFVHISNQWLKWEQRRSVGICLRKPFVIFWHLNDNQIVAYVLYLGIYIFVDCLFAILLLCMFLFLPSSLPLAKAIICRTENTFRIHQLHYTYSTTKSVTEDDNQCIILCAVTTRESDNKTRACVKSGYKIASTGYDCNWSFFSLLTLLFVGWFLLLVH